VIASLSAVAPLTSMASVATLPFVPVKITFAAVMVRAPTVFAAAPGAMVAPLFIVTLLAPALMNPEPPSTVPALFTVTEPVPVPEPEVLFIKSVPALTVVPPV
jgi:hypothetical protein